jgi:phosphatidylglycerophosphatase A
MRKFALLVSTWFGCGFAPVAPGTAGSAAAVALALLGVHKFDLPAWHFGVLAIALIPLSVWCAGLAARLHGTKDPGLVVVDEVLGQWVTLAAAAPLGWREALAGFLLFRFFDIWKPWPVRRLEALPGGTGIVADDLMAGLYGALVLVLARWFNLL